MAQENTGRALSRIQKNRLSDLGWSDYVGAAQGLWISLGEQKLCVVSEGCILYSYSCSTAQAGAGSEKNSCKTPVGWHEVAEKVGDKLPLGAILESRRWTGAMWTFGDPADGDLILSRILRLKGLEDGYNRGGDLDTWERLIYIHGTHAEDQLGQPTSHGCVRLSNADVMELYDLVNLGCRVLITVD